MVPVVDIARNEDHRLQAHETACAFCDRVRSESGTADDWAVLFEDEHFVAVPSLGAFIPGWLLVLPRRHELNLAQMPTSRLDDLWSFVERFLPAWTAEFGPITMFEHGPSGQGRNAGCGIDHAHLHVVPSGDWDLLADAKRQLPMLEWRHVSGLGDVRPELTAGKDYLFLRAPDGRLWAAAHTDVPSQALRRVIAANLHIPERYNWRDHPHRDVVRATIARAERG